jgi:NAD kinase
MVFNKALVVYSDKMTKNHLECLENVKNILDLKKLNYDLVGLHELDEKNFTDSDLIVSVGGDGTFVKAAGLIKDQTIVGINSDPDTSEGLLKSIFAHEIEKLNDVLDGEYKIIKRERAVVFINGKRAKELVVNVVFVGASSQFHCSRYIINFRGQKEEHRSSGVIISTGTGSTAWHQSAGGEVFGYNEKKLRFLVREPYRGKRLFLPKILSGEISEDESIEIISMRDFKGVVAIDDSVYKLNKGDKVEIKLSSEPLKVIVLK